MYFKYFFNNVLVYHNDSEKMNIQLLSRKDGIPIKLKYMDYKFILIAKKFLFCIFTVMLIVGIISVMDRATERDISRYSYQSFLKDDTEYDILFFGQAMYIQEFHLCNYGIITE